MSAPTATEKSQDADTRLSRNQAPNLDGRYGKIGISAVAGAIRHNVKQRDRGPARRDSFRYDYD